MTFNRHRVRYLVVGGVATVLYGNPRFTKDLDVLVDTSEANLRKIITAFKVLGFVPRVPVKPEAFVLKENREKWRREKNMLAFTFINPATPFENVDILTEGHIDFTKAYRKKKIFTAGSIKIPVIAKTDLIRMKKRAGRVQDLQDVAILSAVRKKARGKS